jgi:hypothetical protein
LPERRIAAIEFEITASRRFFSSGEQTANRVLPDQTTHLPPRALAIALGAGVIFPLGKIVRSALRAQITPASRLDAQLADRGERSDRARRTSGRTSRQFGRVSNAGSSIFAGGRCARVLAASGHSGCGWVPFCAPQRLEVGSAETGLVPEAITPAADESGGAEQGPALLRARSSRIRASNSPGVG